MRAVMVFRIALLLLCALFSRGGIASPAVLPIYIEDNHAGSFYWLAQHLDLRQPCTLIHFDAHCDASNIFDSDKIRNDLRRVASVEERTDLLERWRNHGVVQCFNWIEPLMPAPIARVVWVPAEKLDSAEARAESEKAASLLDANLEAAPRSAGRLRERYLVSDLAHLSRQLKEEEPIVVTIDLDYFEKVAPQERRAAFEHVWSFVLERRNLRAVTFAISLPYLKSEDDAHQLLTLALNAALSVPLARIEFEPFLSVAHDRSIRARAFEESGQTVPAYQVEHAPEELRAQILAERERITVEHDGARWDGLLRAWTAAAPALHLELKGAQPSTDRVWRIPASDHTDIEIVADPWMSKVDDIRWSVLVPKYPSCNVTGLSRAQVGFVANASPRPAWREIAIDGSDPQFPINRLDQFFDRETHAGSLRVRARARVNGTLRQTPVMEVRRFCGTGFRAALSEQFGLPYLFGSGALNDGRNTGAETNLGTDCANFMVYALRRQGQRIPWSDPKQLRENLNLAAASVSAGEVHFTSDELERGLIVHLGTHVAAVIEDRPPLGILDGNDLVAHQLKACPETIRLSDLLRDRNRITFDLFCSRRPPGDADASQSEAATAKPASILFGGDIMLGRSCAQKIEQGINPFAGVSDLLRRASFAAANLECTITDASKAAVHPRYSFPAPLQSAALLRTAGFRAVGLANNHALDFGPEGLKQCANFLKSENVSPVGVEQMWERPQRHDSDNNASAPAIFPLPNGKRLALLAINDADATPSLDRGQLASALSDAQIKADFLVALVHWGTENTSMATARQRELARWLVDHGVDAIAGSHPHCVQPLDFYHGRPIAYSLGNFVFDGAPSVASWNQGALLEIGLSDQARVNSVRLIPIVLKDGLPQMSETSEKRIVTQK